MADPEKPSATACPTGRFADLVRTPSGLTLTDPVGGIATEYDYRDWDQVAQGILAKAGRSWERLKASSKVKIDTAEYDRLVGEINRVRTNYSKMRPAWPVELAWLGNVFNSADVTAMSEIASEAACLYQQIEAVLEQSGEALGPAEKPPEKPGILETITVVAVAAAVVTGGFLAVRAFSK